MKYIIQSIILTYEPWIVLNLIKYHILLGHRMGNTRKQLACKNEVVHSIYGFYTHFPKCDYIHIQNQLCCQI